MSVKLTAVVSTRLEKESRAQLGLLAARHSHSIADELRAAVRFWLMRDRIQTSRPAAGPVQAE